MPVILTRPSGLETEAYASTVLNNSNIPGATVKDALEWLDSNQIDFVDFKCNQSLNTVSGTKIYSLLHTPVSGTVQIFVNGLLQEPGVGKDYTIEGDVITFALDLEVNDVLLASYMI